MVKPLATRTILVINIVLIIIFLSAVAAFVWWQNGFEDFLPIRGDKVDVGLVPAEGVYLAARYYPSQGKVANRGVILLHQYNSNQNAWNDLAAELQDRNFEVITLDFRGHGESSGSRDYQAFASDAAEAVEYLHDINASMRIAVMGAGLGANVALQLANQNTALQAVALISPQHNYQGIKITGINKTFTRPIYYLVSSSDPISLAATQGLYENSPASDKALRIAEEAKGRGTKLLRHAPKLRSALIDWLEVKL